MDDFRAQLTEVIDALLAEGREPQFLVVDMWGAEYIKHAHGIESLDKFRSMAIDAISNAADGDVFAQGEYRLVGIVPGFPRLKTFALIQKLQRTLPLLAQGFDCILQPEFDIVGYDANRGVAGVITELVRKPVHPSQRDVA